MPQFPHLENGDVKIILMSWVFGEDECMSKLPDVPTTPKAGETMSKEVSLLINTGPPPSHP